jgi:muramoyltetrapeptide carboxypeptidase
MQKPPFLKSGDIVSIISPSGKIQPEPILNAVKWLNSWGLEVRLGKNCLNKWFNFAGRDDERLYDLQTNLNDHEIKALFCSRGGYGMIRLIDKLYFDEFIKQPKWLVGFSDVTFLHSCLNNLLGFASIHGPMPVKFPELSTGDASMIHLKNMLFGEKIEYQIPTKNKNIPGKAQGVLIGGNLAALNNLNGSRSDFDPADKILLIEDIDEYYYQIDRMLWALERSHDLFQLKGVIVGQFTQLKDNEIPFGFTLDDSIRQHFEKYNIPVCYDFPAGHGDVNWPLILGSQLIMDVKSDHTNIEFLI